MPNNGRAPSINCSCPDDYQAIFSQRGAASAAARFRRRGLTGTSRTIVSALRRLGFRGRSVLEIGGGLGEVSIELLSDGVIERATNIDLATNWESAADELLRERGLQDRVRRWCADFVAVADSVPSADLVILNRVVCCYPDWRRLLAKAAANAERCFVFSFPRPWTQSVVWIENLFHRLRGRSFRAFVHPPRAMTQLLTESGFEISATERSMLWRTVVLTRQ